MSERVLWLRLCVTGPTPECGEIVGLRIVDRQAHRTVFDAFFQPVREDGWKSVPAGGTYVNLSNRLPLSIYVEGIERILSGATRRARGTRHPFPARRRRPYRGPGRGAQRHGRTS